MSTGGQQRSREEAALQAPWSRVGQMAYSFSRSQTWEAPELQDHRKPPGRFCANQRSSHTSGGMQPWARVRLGEWSLGWILVSIHQFPTHLANPETLLWWGAGSWGQLCSCWCVPSATLHWRFGFQVRSDRQSTRGHHTATCQLLDPALPAGGRLQAPSAELAEARVGGHCFPLL